MIKFLKFAFNIMFISFLGILAFSNRETITLHLYPLEYEIIIPCYLLIIAIFIVSVLICFIMSCFSKSLLRKEIKEMNKLVSILKEENSLYKERLEKFKQEQL
ncbi:MAG: hypothetical protein BWY78_00361 [Alphaproteobacteria bacterium ADurb.Bin438]|nr:MAG: hypothetical protein BWY78_00361 [Alphaproteobacteria bacterium ADurb.Bin438]